MIVQVGFILISGLLILKRMVCKKLIVLLQLVILPKRVIVEKYGINPDKIKVVHNAVYPIAEGSKTGNCFVFRSSYYSKGC